jgi:ABC-2 type transport system ATP-binding protein
MPRAYRQQVQELAAVLGIEKEIFKPVKTFSGGMKRKLEIIRSLVHRPRVLFLDEPTSGLDPSSRRTLWEYLREVRAQSGTTVFLTTHYLEEAEEADHVCIINKGKIVSAGTPTEIKADLIQNYLEVDAPDRGRLRAELSQLGLEFTEASLFRIKLDGHSPQQIIKSIETPLSVLKTHMPTLEDAYLAIVEQDEKGGSG